MSNGFVPFTEVPPSIIIHILQSMHNSTRDRNHFQETLESIPSIPSYLVHFIMGRYREDVLQLEEQDIVEIIGVSEQNMIFDGSGLTKETIRKNLHDNIMLDKVEGVCAICLEEYKEYESISTLICSHEFHADCIRRWMLHKNICPLCKSVGLNI